nr:hypothetical protein GCM10020063_006910 [Dactylosporangium thailandense]
MRVATDDGPAWLLRRRRDVVAALADPRLSPCPRHAAGADYRGYDLPPAFRETIISAEPDDHRRLRRLVSPLMDRAAAHRSRPRLRRAAEQALLAAGERFDLVQDFAGPYVAAATADWLGLPRAQREAYTAWANRVVGPGSATVRARDTLLRHRGRPARGRHDRGGPDGSAVAGRRRPGGRPAPLPGRADRRGPDPRGP